MAAELKNELGLDSKLIPAGSGVFKVTSGGRVLYDKKTTGRFPNPGEVVAVY